MNSLDAVAALERTLEDAPTSEFPKVLGELERLKARVWARLLTAPAVTSSPLEQSLLTLPQVAKRLNIPETHAYELARQGKLPALHIGKYVRVDPGELADWMAQRSE